MSKKLVSNNDIKILSKNKYVKKISKKGIMHTDEFKRLFIIKNEKGKFPRDIFEKCGFDIEIIALKRIQSIGKVLLTDVSYLFFKDSQKAYLSTILDASSNEVLAYNISKGLKIDIVTDILDKLIENNGNILREDSFIHSDQGVHNTNTIFQNKVRRHNL